MLNLRRAYTNALLVDAQNNALILTRSDSHPRHPLEADLPGGILGRRETHEHGIVREIREETGIVVFSSDLVEIYKGKASQPGWKEQSVFVVHLKEVEPTVVLSWEHDSFEWVPVEQVPYIAGSIQGKIERLIDSGFFESI